MECTETGHAAERLKERLGATKDSAHRIAQNALDRGMWHSEARGGFKRYLDSLYLSHRVAANMRIYRDAVFLFDAACRLITVVPLPRKYRDLAKRAREE